MNSFLKYLKTNDPSSYKALSKYAIGTSGFDKAWKALAKNDPKGFDSLQHDFIKGSHYSPAVKKIATMGIDINKRSNALQQVVWSMGTQHGSGGALSIFRNANITNSMSDAEIIKRLYAERSKVNKYFSSSSQGIRNSVKNRFERELQDALALL